MKKQKDKWVTMYAENIEPSLEEISINCNQFKINILDNNVLEITCHNNYKLEVHELSEEHCNKLYNLIKTKVENQQSFRLPPIPLAYIIIIPIRQDVETLEL